MARQAKVTSIDVVERFAAALKCFEEDSQAALDGIDMEIRKAIHWIRVEQRDYWTARVRRGWDEVNIARKELERRLMFYPGDDRPSAHDQRMALEKARQRLRTAEQKVEAVKRWSYRLEREINEYVAAITQLKGWMEHDLPRAHADLARMRRALEDYVALHSEGEGGLPLDLAALIGGEPESPPETPDGGGADETPEAPETPEGQGTGRAHETDPEEPPHG